VSNPYRASTGQADIFGNLHHKPRPKVKARKQSMFADHEAELAEQELREAAEAEAQRIEDAYRRFAGEDQNG